MANTISSISYNGYTYRVGDQIKVSNNTMYTSITASSGNTINMLSQCVMKIDQIWEGSSAGVAVKNPLKISWVSGPSGSQNGGGYIRLNQIVSGSGGTANKITLIFNANGGSGTMSNQTVTYGVTTHLKKCTFTRTNYKFTGWNIYRDVDDKWYGYNSDNKQGWYPKSQIVKYSLMNDEASLTKWATEGSVYLYAQWEYNVTAPVAGTITAKGSGENANTSTEFEQVTVSWSGFKAGTNNPISHYEIWFQESTDNKNWDDRERVKNVNTTATSGSTTIGTVDHSTSASDWGTRGRYYRWSVVAIGETDSDLYSSTDAWSGSLKKSSVSAYTFNANGGSGAPATYYKFSGYGVTFPSTKPTKTGHTFAYWTRSGSSTHYTAGQSNVQGLPDANTTFTANYTANKYVITYKANGGSGANQTQTCTYGQDFTAKGAIFTRTGYTLDYWTTPAGSWALNGTNVYGWAQNVEFLAHWKANTYTVTYNANGGSDAPGSQSFTYGSTLKLSSTKPTRTGYTFVHWSTKNNDTGISYNPGDSYSSAASVTLYAIWKINTYTVTFNANGGVIVLESVDSDALYDSSNHRLYALINGTYYPVYSRKLTTTLTTKKVNHGSAIGTLPVAEKPYHKFIGWFTSATGGTQISSSQTITSDRTYYAHYEIPENLYQRVNGKWVPGKMYQYYSGAWHQVIPLTYHTGGKQ